MLVWKGNTLTGIYYIAQKNANIAYFIITNTSCCDVTMNLKIRRGSIDTQISPKDLQLAKGESYTDRDVVILQDEYLILTNSGPLDYYFSMPNA